KQYEPCSRSRAGVTGSNPVTPTNHAISSDLRRASVTTDDHELRGRQLRERLAQHWQSPDWRALASTPAFKMLGTPGEWDPPDGVVAKRDTMYLSVGIPDSATLPRAALNAAMQKVLAENGDASLRYGFGQGYYPLRSALATAYNRLHPCDITDEWFQ